MTAKRILTLIVLAPLTIVLLAFIFANRSLVRLALNPFNPDESAWSFTAPFFIWLFVFSGIGVIIGSAITWMSQSKYRKAARENAQKLAAAQAGLQQQGHTNLPKA